MSANPKMISDLKGALRPYQFSQSAEIEEALSAVAKEAVRELEKMCL